MNKPTPTKVVFRKFKDSGDVIAMFPEIAASLEPGLCQSYQNVGQHGACSTGYEFISRTKLATETEYADLKKELEIVGYDLDIKKKITYTMDKVRFDSIRAVYRDAAAK